MTTTAPSPSRETATLHVRTRALDVGADLLSLLPAAHDAVSWVREGDGLVGWGEAFRIEVSGPNRFERAESVWRQVVRSAVIDDEVGHPGCGLVGFASFAFSDHPGSSVVVVPRVIAGRRAGQSWVTEIRSSDREFPVDTTPVAPARLVRWREGEFTAQQWRQAVAEAVRRMKGGAFDKVVLARDVIAEAGETLDPRFLLHQLAARFPECWTFAVDGLVGATPELLLRRAGSRVSSRVLAGSTWPGADTNLLESVRHREEHRFAVDSLAGSLAPHCAPVQADGPFVLRLRNIAHLATDVTGTLPESTSASLFQLAAAVHPTAAVGGTPRGEAMRTIAELEQRAGLDRGRYAAPVGWIDADGDGELGIALRCAQFSGQQARLFAGCGIIADSDPETELEETHAKFAAVRDALGG